MSDFSEIKKRPPLKKTDAILFSLLVILTCVLFFAFFKGNGELNEIFIEIKNEKCFSYSFASDSYKVEEGFDNFIAVEKTDGIYTVKINTDGHFNLIEINTVKKTVKMKDADCPNKDCVFSFEIVRNGQQIACVPHRLIVYAGGSAMPNPSTGV